MKSRKTQKKEIPLTKVWQKDKITVLELIPESKDLQFPIYKHPTRGYVIFDETPRHLIWWQDYIESFFETVRVKNPKKLSKDYLQILNSLPNTDLEEFLD